jgi:hypothetical protein
MLYADGSLKDGQLLIRLLLQKNENTNIVGGWKLKFTFYFMEKTHELLHLEKWSFLYIERSWTCQQVLFESLFCLTELLNMAVFRNYEVMFKQTQNYFV